MLHPRSMLAHRDMGQKFPDCFGIAIPVPRKRCLRCGLTNFAPELGLSVNALHPLCERLPVARLAKKKAVDTVVNVVSDTRRGGCNRGQAARHRFGHW